MHDKALFVLIRQTLLAQLVARGYSDVLVIKGFQPTQQGQPSARTIYMSKQFEKPHGSPKAHSLWNPTTQQFDRPDLQKMEVTFQFSATSSVSLTNMSALTEMDLLNIARMIMQSEEFQTTLAASNVGILRVLNIRAPQPRNDFNQFRPEPSFDMIVTHNRSSDIVVNEIDATTGELIGV